MKNIFKQTSDHTPQIRAYMRFEKILATISLPLFWAGQAIQTIKNEEGEFIYPQFLRHHLTNLTDPVVLGGFAMFALNRLPVKWTLQNRVLATSFMVAALGIGYEAMESKLPDRHFDYRDTAIFLMMTAATIGAKRYTMDRIDPQLYASREKMPMLVPPIF